MFGSLGMQELIIIFVVALIVFGPRKLPELGRSLGKSLQEFKRASNELRHTLDEEISLEEKAEKSQKRSATSAATPPNMPPPVALSDTGAPVIEADDSTGDGDAADTSAPDTVARGQQHH